MILRSDVADTRCRSGKTVHDVRGTQSPDDASRKDRSLIVMAMTQTNLVRRTTITAVLLTCTLVAGLKPARCQQDTLTPHWPWQVSPATATSDWFDAVDPATTLWIVRGQDRELARPNARDPGTDFSDFPNSGEVVPVGEFYLSGGWNYVTSRGPPGHGQLCAVRPPLRDRRRCRNSAL